MSLTQNEINRYRVTPELTQLEADPLAVETPLQISLASKAGSGQSQVFSLLMRTPGNDEWLIYGLLFSEGLIKSQEDILHIKSLESDQLSQGNLKEVLLADGLVIDLEKMNRSYASYSGCGLCGKTSLQALELRQSRPFKALGVSVDNELVKKLKSILAKQPLFSTTGGVHVAGLVYEKQGELCPDISPFFEDVGRHNALDKLIGYELKQNDLVQPGILLLSGRVGFELVQKAIMAGFSVIVALGAPSHLAVQAANQFGVALIGFAKDQSFNLYTSNLELLK